MLLTVVCSEATTMEDHLLHETLGESYHSRKYRTTLYCNLQLGWGLLEGAEVFVRTAVDPDEAACSSLRRSLMT